MKSFDEIVNDIVYTGYYQELTEQGCRKVFEMLPDEVRWNGTYHGWKDWETWQEVCKAVHKYMEVQANEDVRRGGK